ncbi:hypothetical protein C8R48DRAFT_834644 [Suillus tomentosus]|nr:hypothetical protein C8R48DRAFT_834644 [Suillus tomentosus]
MSSSWPAAPPPSPRNVTGRKLHDTERGEIRVAYYAVDPGYSYPFGGLLQQDAGLTSTSSQRLGLYRAAALLVWRARFDLILALVGLLERVTSTVSYCIAHQKTPMAQVDFVCALQAYWLLQKTDIDVGGLRALDRDMPARRANIHFMDAYTDSVEEPCMSYGALQQMEAGGLIENSLWRLIGPLCV